MTNADWDLVHWHVVDDVLYERPVGACEHCGTGDRLDDADELTDRGPADPPKRPHIFVVPLQRNLGVPNGDPTASEDSWEPGEFEALAASQERALRLALEEDDVDDGLDEFQRRAGEPTGD